MAEIAQTLSSTKAQAKKSAEEGQKKKKLCVNLSSDAD